MQKLLHVATSEMLHAMLYAIEELHHVAITEIVAYNAVYAMAKLHYVATSKIIVCNVAEIETNPTSATLLATISLLHKLVSILCNIACSVTSWGPDLR